MIMDALKTLFHTRDTAVRNKDYIAFASTQIQDIPTATINGYLSYGNLKTEVISVADDTPIKKVAFVKENYSTHTAFLLYYLVNSVDGWKIYNIVSWSLH